MKTVHVDRAGIRRFLLGSVLAACACLFTVPGALAAEKIRVSVGQSVTYNVNSPIKTISIADADVADVVVANPFQILVNGLEVGFTTLVVWDENNNSTRYDVVVRNPFSDHQIELQVKVAEVNKTRMTELGFDYFFRNDRWVGGLYSGSGVAAPSVPLRVFAGDNLVVPTEGLNMALRYMFGGIEVQSMIRAMAVEGALKVLAEPNVVASSGQPASFLSGGELPIPIASSGSTGGTTITIEWKEFGVKVKFLPTIVEEGIISLSVAPEVSNLDYANAVVVSGFQIPSLRVRKAETKVELKDGEVLVIGGLLLDEEREVVNRIPILGHIPILGTLFSSTRLEHSESELLLVISPRIVRALPPGTDVSLPGYSDDGSVEGQGR